MTNRWITASVVGAFFTAFIATAPGQTPVYEIKAIMESAPSGPGETFYVRLAMSQPYVDLSAYQLMVGYNGDRTSLDAIEDNLGQAGEDAEVVLSLGPNEIPFTGVSYANVYRKILLDTAYTLHFPLDPEDEFHLGRLKFSTLASYNPAHGNFGLYLDVDPAAGVHGVWDADISPLQVTFISVDPTSAVSDWTVY